VIWQVVRVEQLMNAGAAPKRDVMSPLALNRSVPLTVTVWPASPEAGVIVDRTGGPPAGEDATPAVVRVDWALGGAAEPMEFDAGRDAGELLEPGLGPPLPGGAVLEITWRPPPLGERTVVASTATTAARPATATAQRTVLLGGRSQ
jgi:hypothetical protein